MVATVSETVPIVVAATTIGASVAALDATLDATNVIVAPDATLDVTNVVVETISSTIDVIASNKDFSISSSEAGQSSSTLALSKAASTEINIISFPITNSMPIIETSLPFGTPPASILPSPTPIGSLENESKIVFDSNFGAKTRELVQVLRWIRPLLRPVVEDQLSQRKRYKKWNG